MIAQADSRKWMACLYNSFLFMEAKIMKMAKKLLALVLTGVMAVSMLTGCALSDRAAANALEKALNSTNTQPTQKVVYNYDNDLDKKAENAFKSLGNDDAARKDQLATAANKTDLTYIKVGQKDYAYIVINAPKTSDDSHAENWTVSKLHGTNGVIYDAALKTVTDNGSTYTVKNAEKNTSATKAKVNFGVKLVNDGKDSKSYYAVVVVELTKNA
jgi:lipopolysaccharide export LptBFGC system permease protein LptF